MQVVRNYNQIDKFNELFYYDESSPSCLVWKKHRTKIGMPVGRKLKVRGKERYWVVDIQKECYVVHRIIWVMHNGNNSVKEDEDIDHIDQDGFNNKIINLRSVTKSTNSKNKKKRSNNRTGVNGVMRILKDSEIIGYRAEVIVNGEKMQKSFNFSVHGVDGAWDSVVQYRDMLIELDGNYSELHGK